MSHIRRRVSIYAISQNDDQCFFVVQQEGKPPGHYTAVIFSKKQATNNAINLSMLKLNHINTCLRGSRSGNNVDFMPQKQQLSF